MASYQKEAVAIVLDASSTMNSVFESGDKDDDDDDDDNTSGKQTTRFEWAKSAILDSISNLIFRGSRNLCAVYVVNTMKTSHHLSSELFPNVVAYNAADTPSGLLPPTVAFLQRLDATLNLDDVAMVASDRKKPIRVSTWDGVVVAADALSKTSKQKFDRRLLIFTDAQSRLKAPQYLYHIMDGLCRLNCRLEVIIVDFLDKLPSYKVEGSPAEEMDDQSINDSSSGTPTGSESQGELESEGEENINIRTENLKFLQSVAAYTGGSTVAITSKGQLLYPSLGRKISYSKQTGCLLNIAPGLSVPVRFALLTSEAKFPWLKKYAVSIKQDGKVERDIFGEEVTHNIVRTTTHRDPDRPHVELALDQKAKAYCYGSSLIPIGDFDVEGLRIRSDPIISILKYCAMDTIPQSHFIGSPFLITDADPQVMTDPEQEKSVTRSSAVISALAQALNEMNYCAICKFVKKKDDDPLIVALFPLVFPTNSAGTTPCSSSLVDKISVEKGASPNADGNQSCNSQYGLAFVQLPFLEDVVPLRLPSLAHIHEPMENLDACDDLIQSLMISTNNLESTTISNPSLRCMYRNIMMRAIHPNHGIIQVCGSLLPSYMASGAQSSVQKFHKIFPLLPRKQDETNVSGIKGKNVKKRKWWGENEE